MRARVLQRRSPRAPYPWIAAAAISIGTFGGCASDGGGSTGSANDETGPSCTTSADCGEGFVCLQHAGQTACAATCTGSADVCGASASCGGVGVLSVDVCQQPASQESAADPEEQPKLPCQNDAECEAIAPGAICAEWMGERDCTIPCSGESQCDLPPLPGIEADFLTCGEDEGTPGRMACVPDPACAAAPQSCVQLSTPGTPSLPEVDDPPATVPDQAPPATGPTACVQDEQCPGAYACTFDDVCATSCEDSFDCKFEADCSGGVCIAQ